MATSFTVENVTQVATYYATSSVTFTLNFELLRGEAPTNDITLFLLLYSSQSVSISLPFEILIDPIDINLPLILYSGESTASISLPFIMYSLQSYANISTAKWTVKCIVDGVDISSRLVDDIVIEHEEDASTIAQIVYVPTSGSIDPLMYVGKSIELHWNHINDYGVLIFSKKRFTGVISDVEWDTDRRTVHIMADTQLPAYFNNLSKEEIASIVGGIWSDKVWDNEDDATGWRHAQERLSTTENCIWHDENGNIRVTSIRAKDTYDFIYTDSERFHETLTLEYAQRSEMINEIRINIDYAYQRKRERQITFRWKHDPGLCNFYLNCDNASYLRGPFTLCQRSMVESAATGGSWIAIHNINYDELWPAGSYDCACPGGRSSPVVWGWKYVTVGYLYGPDTIITAVDGSKQTIKNPVEQLGYSSPDYEAHAFLCIGANWTGAKRWLQDVDEYYEIVVKCPDSIEVIGQVVSTEEYSFNNDVDNSEWEDSLIPFNEQTPSGGWSTIAGSNDKYINADESDEEDIFNREDFNLAQEVILASTKGDILRSHRLTTVSFTTTYQPSVDLGCTIQVDTPYLVAKGKVKALRDTWSLTTGEASTNISLAISRHNGSGLYTQDPLEPVDRPEPTTEPSIDTVYVLPTYIGGRVLPPGNESLMPEWNDTNFPPDEIEGFFTNYIDTFNSDPFAVSNYIRDDIAAHTYPYQFMVRGPIIDETYTSCIEVATPTEVNIVVPEDLLQITA
jgi:hypothetical protein